MNAAFLTRSQTGLPLKRAFLYSFAAIISFHLAYTYSQLAFLILLYLFCLLQLGRLKSKRLAFYAGLFTGLGCALQASFFWNIFGAAAIALWLILAFWTALFVILSQLCRSRFDKFLPILLIPLLWIGLEYFRSELYYLRFSWINVGYVFAPNLNWLPFHYLGMYGIGFVFVVTICVWELFRPKVRFITAGFFIAALALLTNLPSLEKSPSIALPTGNLRIAGIQFEFPSEPQVLDGLNQLLKKCPDADLLVLSEYTFTMSVPDSLKNWCRNNHLYLIVGGEEPASGSQYRDTAFVIGPDGNIVFQQAKSVPIQFFKDGLPAESQKLWDSPWGKIGICICYDLSYTRVTDRLIRLGAQAIIVPSMDVIDWGRHQHELHARVAPTRAAEYSVPIFRVASSGISQCVNSSGQVLATAPAPGDGAIISGTLNLSERGSLPFDRILAPFAVAIDAVLIVALLILQFTKPIKTLVPNPTLA
jgi:apolipoprotein N-acyltransferase